MAKKKDNKKADNASSVVLAGITSMLSGTPEQYKAREKREKRDREIATAILSKLEGLTYSEAGNILRMALLMIQDKAVVGKA